MQPCEGCGLVVDGGTEGCQSLFDELRSWELVSSTYQAQRMTVDTYCVQHPDRYCVSAKSLAAHLTGLCWALEYTGHPSGLRALQRWLNGPARIEKPPVPSFRGALTVADVGDTPNPESIMQWARSTWEAYSTLHRVARQWVDEATSPPRSRGGGH